MTKKKKKRTVKSVVYTDKKNPKTQIILFGGSIDDLFVAIQPTAKAKKWARKWIEDHPINISSGMMKLKP